MFGKYSPWIAVRGVAACTHVFLVIKFEGIFIRSYKQNIIAAIDKIIFKKSKF